MNRSVLFLIFILLPIQALSDSLTLNLPVTLTERACYTYGTNNENEVMFLSHSIAPNLVHESNGFDGWSTAMHRRGNALAFGKVTWEAENSLTTAQQICDPTVVSSLFFSVPGGLNYFFLHDANAPTIHPYAAVAICRPPTQVGPFSMHLFPIVNGSWDLNNKIDLQASSVSNCVGLG